MSLTHLLSCVWVKRGLEFWFRNFGILWQTNCSQLEKRELKLGHWGKSGRVRENLYVAVYIKYFIVINKSCLCVFSEQPCFPLLFSISPFLPACSLAHADRTYAREQKWMITYAFPLLRKPHTHTVLYSSAHTLRLGNFFYVVWLPPVADQQNCRDLSSHTHKAIPSLMLSECSAFILFCLSSFSFSAFSFASLALRIFSSASLRFWFSITACCITQTHTHYVAVTKIVRDVFHVI